MPGLTRRQVLKSAIAIPAAAGCAISSASRVDPGKHDRPASELPEAGRPRADAAVGGDATWDGLTALAGRVVEVGNPGVVVSGNVQSTMIRALVIRGMLELTGAPTEVDAWRAFFASDDVVGIKVNPFGYPNTFTRIATVAEIVRGLGLAGVANENIVVFDRYADYLAQIGYPTGLPPSVRVEGTVETNASKSRSPASIRARMSSCRRSSPGSTPPLRSTGARISASS